MTEHMAGFFDDFGVTATLLSTAVVRGIFDAAYQDNLGVANDGPRFFCAAADVASVSRGDSLTLPAGDFVVREIRPDGTGMVELVLESD